MSRFPCSSFPVGRLNTLTAPDRCSDSTRVISHVRPYRWCTAWLIMSVVAWTAPAGAQQQPPTIEQSLDLRTAGAPRISPDGQWVVYEVSHTNWRANAFERELWLSDVAGTRHVRLTEGTGSSYDARWSLDGRWIAFLSNRSPTLPGPKLDDSTQIYLISATGGEARELTRVETGVSDLEWAPDGRTIAFTTRDPKSTVRKERDSTYGEIQVVGSDQQMSHLWTIDVPAGDTGRAPSQPRRITEGDAFSVSAFSWSPDGRTIAFAAQRDPDPASWGTSAIYVVTLSDRSVRKIETPGPNWSPLWSPDGHEIAFVTANGNPAFYYANTYLAAVSTSGGAARLLTARFDEIPTPVTWTASGLYFGALQRTYAHLFHLDPASGVIERVTQPDALIATQCSVARASQAVACVAASDNKYAEVIAARLAPFAPTTVTSLGEQLAPFHPAARRQLFQWTSTDGARIEGVLYTPSDFDPSKRHPLLVVIHGGPTGVDRTSLAADRYYPIERFVAKGALILRPNYRGSAGYGEKFRALNVRALGVGDYADVISGVDALIAKGWVDRARVGAMGWSEGGYISAFITTSSDRFRAVSVGAGISDWMTYYVNTDVHPFTRQYLQATPWDDPAIYRKTSPISYVASARTPTLIQHGGNDKRVPIPNAFELYQALRDKGVPVRMVVYPGFGHPIDKPKQQRSVMEENLRWFGHWIWDEPWTSEMLSTAAYPP